jgi:hypothetical protein
MWSYRATEAIVAKAPEESGAFALARARMKQRHQVQLGSLPELSRAGRQAAPTVSIPPGIISCNRLFNEHICSSGVAGKSSSWAAISSHFLCYMKYRLCQDHM